MQELQGDATIKITSVLPRRRAHQHIAHSAKGMPATTWPAQFDKMALTSPAKAADIILDGVEKNRQQVFVGVDAKVLAMMKRVLPAWTVKLNARAQQKPYASAASVAKRNEA